MGVRTDYPLPGGHGAAATRLPPSYPRAVEVRIFSAALIEKRSALSGRWRVFPFRADHSCNTRCEMYVISVGTSSLNRARSTI
jgi:hypothetical protein